MTVGIIGGGASGIAAALAAAENPNVQVLLLERQARLGRKLQATGNGRCNLTNLYAGEGGYHGTQPEFVKPALQKFDPQATLDWFHSLGLFTVTEDGGRVYPYSNQANSVLDVLRLSLERPNIQVLTGFEVKKIQRQDGTFLLSNGEQALSCQRLIVACGGLAGSKLGGTMSGYHLLGKLGHKCSRLRPSLVQIRSNWDALPSLKGIRANAHVQFLRDGQLFAESTGELQFTEMGVSGPVVFEISRDVCYGPGVWTCRLDFLPDYTQESLLQELARRKNTALPVEELFTGILHNRLGRILTKIAGIRNGQFVKDLSHPALTQAAITAKQLEITLTEPLGMDSAQVTAGGIFTDQFDPLTMESRLIKGLYACGEVLDIDGNCGGYNLQWAWSSGRCAGLHAGKETV